MIDDRRFFIPKQRVAAAAYVASVDDATISAQPRGRSGSAKFPRVLTTARYGDIVKFYAIHTTQWQSSPLLCARWKIISNAFATGRQTVREKKKIR